MRSKQPLPTLGLTLGICGIALALSSKAHALTWPDACGNDDVQFKVKTLKKQPVPNGETGKAQIIFIETLDGEFATAPVVRFGVDGAWAGASRGQSYVAFPVPAGTHHFCASRQTSIRAEKENVGVATLNAEAGKIYFLHFKIIRSEVGAASMKGGAMLPGQYPGSMTAKPKDTMDSATFTQLTEEEGRNLLKDAALSTSTARN